MGGLTADRKAAEMVVKRASHWVDWTVVLMVAMMVEKKVVNSVAMKAGHSVGTRAALTVETTAGPKVAMKGGY